MKTFRLSLNDDAAEGQEWRQYVADTLRRIADTLELKGAADHGVLLKGQTGHHQYGSWDFQP